eukprot:UN05421
MPITYESETSRINKQSKVVDGVTSFDDCERKCTNSVNGGCQSWSFDTNATNCYHNAGVPVNFYDEVHISGLSNNNWSVSDDNCINLDRQGNSPAHGNVTLCDR